MKMPCANCEKRHENCHASCEEYVSWKKGHEAQKALLDEQKKLRGEAKEYIKQAVKKCKRSRRR